MEAPTDKPVMSTGVRDSHGDQGEGEEGTTNWMEESNCLAYDDHIGSPLPLISHYTDTFLFDPCFAFMDCFPLL